MQGCDVVFEDISERKAHEESLEREAEKLSWIGRIQEALREGRFELFTQPIVALDDFGTGYSGFTYLKQLPLDFLKIDIEFVRDLATNPASSHVVKAVVALARGFSLKTVAEGVEDAETLVLLGELGVDLAQGYHIARPGPIAG